MARKIGAKKAGRVAAQGTPAAWERAEDIMSHPVAAVRADQTIREAAQVMATRGVSGVAVLDGNGRAVGILSASDIVRYETTRRTWVVGEEQYRRLRELAGRTLGKGAHLEHVEEERVREVMTPKIVKVPAAASVAFVAKVMDDQRIHRVLVEKQGRIAGIVTALDIARSVGRTAAPAGAALESWG